MLEKVGRAEGRPEMYQKYRKGRRQRALSAVEVRGSVDTQGRSPLSITEGGK